MRYKINLFPPPELTLLDKVIFFSFNYLRYILVLTMLVVLGVFTYRFSVDQEIVDLKDTLRQKQEIIVVSKPLLEEAAVIGDRIGNIQSVLKQQEKYNSMLSYYLSVFPEKVSATTLLIQTDEIHLTGVSSDVGIIQSFYSRLKKDNKFLILDLENIKKIDKGYSFDLGLKTFNS